MSYQLGFEALVNKFRERFPQPDFRWEHKFLESKKPGGYVVAGNARIFIGLHLRGPYEEYHYQIFKEEQLICEIIADLTFGIRLTINSPYMKTFVLYRRPMNLKHATQYCRRRWLRDKPQFKKLGANFASHIHKELNK